MIIREVFDDQNRLLRLTADARPHGGQKSISRCDGCRCTKGKVKQNCAAMKAARDHLAHIGEKTRKSEPYINPKTTPHFYCFQDVDIRQPQHCCFVHQFERYQEKMVGIGELLQHSKEEKILALKQIAIISLGHSTVGGTRIGELTADDIQNEILPAIWRGRARATANKKYNFFASSLQWAMVSEKMPSGLLLKMKGIKKPKKADVKKRHVRISATAIEKVIEAATPKYKLLFMFQSQTGARPNETSVLKWSDLDLKNDTVFIERALNKDGVVSRPKTDHGIRTIKLASDLAQGLREWKVNQPIKQRELNLVFPTGAGTRELIGNWSRRGLEPAIEKANVQRFTLYGFRHFYASVLLFDLLLSDRVIMKMMGHEDIQTTLNNYGHWFEDRKERDDNVQAQLDAVFQKS